MAILTVAAALSLSGCHTMDDDRIPVLPVNIAFTNTHMWTSYGVPAAMDYREFIREKQKPAGFFYTASTYTGFGGVLLVATTLGEPAAFDLACPVECKTSVRVAIDADTHLAKCPVCGSTYNVFSLNGYPVSGEAAEKHYVLRPYRVRYDTGGVYRLVTN